MCRNNRTQQEIVDTRRKIEEVKYLLYNLERNISLLEKKKVVEKDSSSVKIAEAEKKCMVAMKELIDKDKEINVDINIFQKEQKVMVLLERTLEKTEKEIDMLLSEFFKEKSYRKWLDDREAQSTGRFQLLTSSSAQAHNRKIVSSSKLKTFITNIYLYF